MCAAFRLRQPGVSTASGGRRGSIQRRLCAMVAVATMGFTHRLGNRIDRRVDSPGFDRTPTNEEYALFFDNVPNGIVLVDEDGKIVLANATCGRLFGYARKELIGKLIDALVPDCFCLAAAPGSLPESPASGVTRGRRHDGTEFPTEIHLTPVTTRAGRFTLAMVVDATDRHLTEKSLADALAERDCLRRLLLQAAEGERQRLARELHDQTGQILTAVMLQTKGLERYLDEAGRDRLPALFGLLDEMGKAVHRIAWELRAAPLNDFGLTAALANQVAEWSTRTGIHGDFLCQDNSLDEIGDDLATAIYRIVQEALTNVARHAPAARHVSVTISRTPEMLLLVIEDDGGGFDAEALRPPAMGEGMGFAGMRERVALFAGEIEVEAHDGPGAAIFVRFPMPPARTET
jgi:PAS domain S-box-containing protein